MSYPYDNNLIRQLRRTQGAVFNHIRNETKQFGLTARQFATLREFTAQLDASQSVIASSLSIERCSLTPVLKHLEKNGYIRRKKSARDYRANRIFVTDTGKNVVSELTKIFQGYNNELIELLPDDESSKLLETLKVLEDYARNRNSSGQIK